MSLPATRWAWEVPLPMAQKCVLMVLADHADDDGCCWPSQPRIAARAGCSIRGVQGALARLEKAGLVTRAGVEGKVTTYRLQMEAVAEPPHEMQGSKGEPPHVVHPPPAPRAPLPLHHVRPNLLLEPKQEAKQAARKPKQRTMKLEPAKPQMPTFSDPPEAWLHLGTGREQQNDGVHATLCGLVLDSAARECFDATRLNGFKPRQDWRPLVGWLRDGLDLYADILPALKRVAARRSYQVPVAGLAYFDQAVRERRAA